MERRFIRAYASHVALERALFMALPPSVYNKINYVWERVHWDVIEVRFDGPSGEHIVQIPKDQWLNDASIARLCLEAP